MPNHSISLAAAVKKNIGEFDARPKGELAVKKRIKIAKVANMCDLPTTNGSGNSGGCSGPMRRPTTAASVLTLMMLFGSLSPAGGIAHGARTSRRANLMSPHLVVEHSNGESLFCSAMKLNSHQVLTAKHCVNSEGTRIKVKNKHGHLQQATKKLVHRDADLAIVTFPNALKGEETCPPPIMSPQTYQALKNNTESNPCGPKGKGIIFGRGLKSRGAVSYNDDSLTAAAFKEIKDRKKLTSLLFEVSQAEDKPTPKSTPGDSGGPIFGCNPETKEFELLGNLKGIVVKKRKDPVNGEGVKENEAITHMVNFGKDPALAKWITDNSNSCVDPVIKKRHFLPETWQTEQPYTIKVSVRNKQLFANASCRISVYKDDVLVESKQHYSIGAHGFRQVTIDEIFAEDFDRVELEFWSGQHVLGSTHLTREELAQNSHLHFHVWRDYRPKVDRQ